MPETAIAEHGPAEDLHTAALVGTDGSIGSAAHPLACTERYSTTSGPHS
jgi:hypothetical protein